MNYLLLYSSTDGQTKKIILKIAEHLCFAGGQCDIHDLSDNDNFNLSEYNKVLIGGAIRYGHFNKKLIHFVSTHQNQLNSMVSGFIGVNLTARKEDKNTAQTNTYVRKFLGKTPWKPTKVAVFAGALLYPRYNWFDRFMIRLIMKMTKGETDTSKEVEYTDWAKVEAFATEFAEIRA